MSFLELGYLHFYEKMNALNDTKTSELSKSAEGNGEYLSLSMAFVEALTKCKFPNGKTGLEAKQMLHKNKYNCLAKAHQSEA